MLLNIISPDNTKHSMFYEAKTTDGTNEITESVVKTFNLYHALISLQTDLDDLKNYGPHRHPEFAGLDGTQENELPELGEDVDKYSQRCGIRPSPNTIKLIDDILEKIAEIMRRYEKNVSVNLSDLTQIVDLLKGTILIGYPNTNQNLELVTKNRNEDMSKQRDLLSFPDYDPIKVFLDNIDEFISGDFEGSEQKGFYKASEASLFFAGRSLTNYGETLKSLGCTENSKIKITLNRNASYAPRSSEDDARAEAMRFFYEREKRQKTAELTTGDEAYESDWADSQSLKKAFLGLNTNIRYK